MLGRPASWRFGGATAVCVVMVSAAACSFPWDSLDPGATSGAGGAGGQVAGTGTGHPTTATDATSTSSRTSSASTGTHATTASTGGAGTTGTNGVGGANPAAGGGGALSTSNGGGTTGSGTGGGAPLGTCGNPIEVTVPSTTGGNNTGKPLGPTASCFPGGETVVYHLTAPQAGVLVISVVGASDLAIAVDKACSDAATEVACEDENGTGEAEEARVVVTQGESLFVAVEGADGGDVGQFSVDVSIHALVCGDGIVDPTEACDPPDSLTCSATCQGLPEVCNDGVDNDRNDLTDCEDTAVCASSCPLASDCAGAVPLLAHNVANTMTGTKDFAGSCVGNQLAPEKIFKYTSTGRGALILDLSSSVDLGMYTRATCSDPSTETVCVDNSDASAHELYALPMRNGEVTNVFVDGFQGAAAAFTLDTSFVAVTETEPNGSAVQANAFASPYIGTIEPATDEDWVSVVVPDGKTLTAEVLGLVAPSCADDMIDSALEIFDVDGTTRLVYDDDGGVGYCSKASAGPLTAGTYFVKVSGFTDTFAYELAITIQ